MTAQAYRSQAGSGNFLHLAVQATELRAGENLPVHFHLKTNNNAVRDAVQYFTYLIMSKGRIVRTGRQRHEAGQNLVIMTLPVTPELVPSFRIVAYYHVLPGEIVADSVWVDVQDTCMGTVSVPQRGYVQQLAFKKPDNSYAAFIGRPSSTCLDVSVLLPRRASPVKYRIENRNALVARSAETKVNEDFTVKAEGVGKGTMTVVTVYNAKVPDKDDKCDSFDLRVQVEEVAAGQCPQRVPKATGKGGRGDKRRRYVSAPSRCTASAARYG
ncbi:venom factor-like [Manacus vitellinus]|uniref:venom factor-like n=1 Tax=Manacus vitellinus TaxID=328815 RepID=UPI00115CF37A|nr:venom factor-like [Manacus vitellinus]